MWLNAWYLKMTVLFYNSSIKDDLMPANSPTTIKKILKGKINSYDFCYSIILQGENSNYYKIKIYPFLHLYRLNVTLVSAAERRTTVASPKFTKISFPILLQKQKADKLYSGMCPLRCSSLYCFFKKSNSGNFYFYVVLICTALITSFASSHQLMNNQVLPHYTRKVENIIRNLFAVF